MGFLRVVTACFSLAFSFFVHAESIPATGGYIWFYKDGSRGDSDTAVLNSYCQFTVPGATTCTMVNGANPLTQRTYHAEKTVSGTVFSGNGTFAASYGNTCPSGQNWTIQGTNCTRPDCVSPQVRDASTGLCVPPPDPCASRTGSSTGWYTSAVGSSSLESSQYCDNGCTVGLNPAPTGTAYTNGKLRVQQYTKVQLSYSCTAGLATAPGTVDSATTPPEPQKNPPCAASEGVLTSSSGTIACVPSGTPASAPPIVDKKKKTDSFPDGSQKVEETITTRDPQTGVEDKRTTTTTTPASSGSTGQAGTPGTSTSGTVGGTVPTTASGTGKEGDTSNDFCQKNPTIQICKGGMNEEVTQKKVEEHLKAVRDGLNPESIDPKTFFEGLDASDADKKIAADKLIEYVSEVNKFGTSADPAAGKYAQFTEAMSAGWFEPIQSSSCSPFSARIGPYTWAFDHCPTAAKISEIGAYCMWVLLAFGCFNLLTREGR